MRTNIVLLTFVASLSQQAMANDVPPQAACIFFFNAFTPDVTSVEHPERAFRIVEIGDMKSETVLTVPRYTLLNWPNGIAISRSPARPDLELEPIAFEFSCLVDTKETRVLTVSVGPGRRIGEIVTVDSGTTRAKDKPTVPAANNSLSMRSTPMQGLF